MEPLIIRDSSIDESGLVGIALGHSAPTQAKPSIARCSAPSIGKRVLHPLRDGQIHRLLTRQDAGLPFFRWPRSGKIGPEADFPPLATFPKLLPFGIRRYCGRSAG